jgi:hypothetical protein
MQKPPDRLRDRFDYLSWSQPELRASALGWGFRLLGTEIPGWEPHRIQVVDLPGEPCANLSVWRPTDKNGQLLAVNIFECDSVRAARIHLLRLLGEVREADVRRVADPGDVAFASGWVVRLFVRDNYVAYIRSIERAAAPVSEVAQIIDRVLSGHAETRGERPPQIRTLQADLSNPSGAGSIPIRMDATDPAGPVWVRLDTPSGSFRIERGAPAFVPSRSGPQLIRVHVSGPNGAIEKTLRIEAVPPETRA